MGAAVPQPGLVDEVVAGVGNLMQQGFLQPLRLLGELQAQALGLSLAGHVTAQAVNGVALAHRESGNPPQDLFPPLPGEHLGNPRGNALPKP